MSQRLGYLLQLLDSGVVSLKSTLNDLGCFMLTLSKFFQSNSILLFLLKHLLISLAGLLGLADKLLDDLLTLVDLAGDIRIQSVVPPWQVYFVIRGYYLWGKCVIFIASVEAEYMLRIRRKAGLAVQKRYRQSCNYWHRITSIYNSSSQNHP